MNNTNNTSEVNHHAELTYAVKKHAEDLATKAAEVEAKFKSINEYRATEDQKIRREAWQYQKEINDQVQKLRHRYKSFKSDNTWNEEKKTLTKHIRTFKKL